MPRDIKKSLQKIKSGFAGLGIKVKPLEQSWMEGFYIVKEGEIALRLTVIRDPENFKTTLDWRNWTFVSTKVKK